MTHGEIMTGRGEEEEDFGQQGIIIKNLSDAIGFASRPTSMLSSLFNK